jgi:hypothetical protein
MLLLVVRCQEIASKEFIFKIFLGEAPRRELRALGARNSGLRPQSVPPLSNNLESPPAPAMYTVQLLHKT